MAGPLEHTPDEEALTAADFLKQQLKARGLDQSQLADLTGVSRQTINAIVRGRQPISRSMSAKLGQLFGQPPDFWLREQFRRASQHIASTPLQPGDDPGSAAPQAGAPETGRSRILTDEEIHLAVERGTVGITPFQRDNINAASIDLGLGEVDALGRDSAARSESDHTIEIAPLECAHAWSLEHISLPADMMARVGPMARLSHLGLFLGHGLQVDPGFEGKLAFSLFNASPNPISLRAGEAILSLELVQLSKPSKRPIDGARELSDFAERASRQFADADPAHRVRAHLRQHMETTEGAGTHVSRIAGTPIEAESNDRGVSREACIETCLRVIRDEAETEARMRQRSDRWRPLEDILGDMKLEVHDFDLLLKEASVLDHDAGSATIQRPNRQKLTLPYPDAGVSVRVRHLTSPMHLDVSAFMIVQYLLAGGTDFSLFPESG